MHLCLFEDQQVTGLYPLTHTRGVYQLRTGALTLLERLRRRFQEASFSLHTRAFLADFVADETRLPVNTLPDGTGVLFINGRVTTLSDTLIDTLRSVARAGESSRVFMQGEELVAAWVPQAHIALVKQEAISRDTFDVAREEAVEGAGLISRLWHLIDHLHPTLLTDLEDFRRELMPANAARGVQISPYATLLNPSEILLAPGARIRAGAILDPSNGPIVLDRNAEVMELSIVRGPVYIGPGSTVKARTEVEGSAIGPVCKLAGEVMDVIFHAYSNKAHTGFLGHSYLGTWCNLGAGTTSSNLRNDYGKVSLYNESLELYEATNRQFLGLFMADHSKCGINSMLNTGTVVGVFCNLHGSGFLPRYIPSFSWGGPDSGFEQYRIEKALEVARRVMARRRLELSDTEAALLRRIHDATRTGSLTYTRLI